MRHVKAIGNHHQRPFCVRVSGGFQHEHGRRSEIITVSFTHSPLVSFYPFSFPQFHLTIQRRYPAVKQSDRQSQQIQVIASPSQLGRVIE